ncbi:hypothetical protein [Bandra megavirus]|uniref:Uncharacterized protein n=1 Tax=Bandra megavirus TaxID=2071566 RepID=A0A2K9V9S1_9VIRU|nr:hypothetical protein [Bandra megavirus]
MNGYQHYDIIDELKNFMDKKSRNVDINKIIHDIIGYPENISGENMHIDIDNRIYCNVIPKNLSTISLESILASDINIAKKYVSNNKHNIIFMNYVKDKFRNLVNRCMTDFIFYTVYHFAQNTTFYDDERNYFIYGEYIRNCFFKDYVPCKTMEINVSDGDLYDYLESFLEIYFYVQHNYSNIASFRDEGQRVYSGREYYTLYPQTQNKNFMTFLLSRCYIQNILKLFDKSNWFILLETINNIKMDLLVTTSDYNIKTNFNVNNLCLRIHSDFRQKLNLDNVLHTLSTNAKILYVDNLSNEDYDIFNNNACIIPLKNKNIGNILNDILDRKFIINNNEANTIEHKCINIYSKTNKKIWKKRSRHSRIMMENYHFMINNGWSCFNQKCDNIDCILYYI